MRSGQAWLCLHTGYGLSRTATPAATPPSACSTALVRSRCPTCLFITSVFPCLEEWGRRHTAPSLGFSPQNPGPFLVPAEQYMGADYTQASARILESDLGLHPSLVITNSVSLGKLLSLPKYPFPQFKIGISLTLQDGHED